MLSRLGRRLFERYRPHPVARAEREAKDRLPAPFTSVRNAINEADRQFGISSIGNKFLNHIFPTHWSFFLGEIAMYSFIVLVASGIFLTFYYVPSQHQFVYHGFYKPLDGQVMTEAYASVLRESLVVRFGLAARQIHHWSAEVFIAAICVHCCRIFFTSAYRRPRKLNWMIGVTMLLLAIFDGYFGYSMTNDLLAGTGVRIGYGMVESIPFIGSYLATWGFDGQYPGNYLNRFFVVHVYFIPVLIAALLAVHLLLIFRQEHTQWGGKHRTEKNVVGDPLMPMFAVKTTGLFLMVAGGLVVMGGIAQVDPVWALGPYNASHVSYAAQPDWYLTWVEGALREMPSWQWTGWGHTVPWNVFTPGVIFPTSTFVALYSWPWLEGWFMDDRELHHLAEPPRNRPAHTGIGVGFLTFYIVEIIASGDDVEASFFHLSLNAMVWSYRIAQFVVPTIAGVLAYFVCRDLQKVPSRRRLRQPMAVELADGSYQPVFDGPPLAEDEEPPPARTPDAILVPDGDGKRSRSLERRS